MNFNDTQAPVLVVDDNEDDVFILRRSLALAGYHNHVLAFVDGEDVLIYLKGLCVMITAGLARIPVVMFCDVRMPRLDGFEVLSWVRAQPALAGLQIVMLSTSDLVE